MVWPNAKRFSATPQAMEADIYVRYSQKGAVKLLEFVRLHLYMSP